MNLHMAYGASLVLIRLVMKRRCAGAVKFMEGEWHCRQRRVHVADE